MTSAHASTPRPPSHPGRPGHRHAPRITKLTWAPPPQRCRSPASVADPRPSTVTDRKGRQVKLTSVEHLAPDGSPDDAEAGMTLAVTLPERSAPTMRRKHMAQEDTMTIQEIHQGRANHQRARHGGGPTMTVLVGGLCGLAWAAGLRGFMAQIGSESTVDWAGTFGWILLPGIGVGALLGWAEQLRSSGGRPGWRWLALSPLLFSAILFSRPLDLLSIFEDGWAAARSAGTRYQAEDHAGPGSSAAARP
jgi:hypothetical protein